MGSFELMRRPLLFCPSLLLGRLQSHLSVVVRAYGRNKVRMDVYG